MGPMGGYFSLSDGKKYMARRSLFNDSELCTVHEAVSVSEDLVSNYYKMSSSQWIRNRYDVRTARELEVHELVEGPFAQVVGYRGCRKNVSLGSAQFDYYRICIQDGAVLDVVKPRGRLGALSLSLVCGGA